MQFVLSAGTATWFLVVLVDRVSNVADQCGFKCQPAYRSGAASFSRSEEAMQEVLRLVA